MREFASPKRQDVQRRPRPRHGWFWALLAVLALAAALVAATPYALRYGLERWLLSQGAARVSIGDLRANPLSGALQINDLAVYDDHDRSLLHARDLRARFDWHALLERTLGFDHLQIKHGQVVLGAGAARWLAGRSDSDWALKIGSIELADTELQWQGAPPATGVHIAHATIAPWSNRHDTPTDLALEGSFDGAPLRLHGNVTADAPLLRGDVQLEVTDLDLAQLSWLAPGLEQWHGRLSTNLRIQSRRDANQRPLITHEGTVRVQSLRMDGPRSRARSQNLVWAGDGQIEPTNDGIRLQQQGQLSLAQAELDTPAGSYRADSLEWHGEMNSDADGHLPVSVRTDGTVQGNGLSFQPVQAGLSFSSRRAQWQGLISHGAIDVPGGWSAHGRLQLTDTKLTEPEEPKTLLSAARAMLHDVDMKGTYELRAGRMELWNYLVLSPSDAENQAAMEGNQAVFNTVSFIDRNRFEAAELDLDGVSLQLRKRRDGSWFGLPARIAPARAPGENTWRIGQIALSGNGNTLRFMDQSVQPVFTRLLELRELKISDLDSATPHQPSPLALQARADDGTRIVAVGKWQPFTAATNLAVKIKASRMPLTLLSPYSVQHLGHRIDSGIGQVDSNLHVVDGKLRSQNALQLRDLKLTPANRTGTLAFRESLALPLSVTADLLRDADRNVVISFPLRGDLQNDDFQLGVAFDHALGSALHRAAINSVAEVLHPFGIADTSLSNGLQLEPLRFRAGSAAVNQVARTYLRRVAVLLRDRPAVRLRVCGRAGEGDNAPPEALATQRGDAVREILAQVEQIDPGRLLGCSPATDPVTAGPPRAELHLL